MSKRWRPLWGYITSMNFEDPNTLRCGVTITEKSEKRSWYIDWVNQVINSHKGSTLDQFSIDFDLDKTSSPVIDRWLDFALSRRLQRLDFVLNSRTGWLPWSSVLYAFPEGVYSQLKAPAGLSSIKCLTSLQLGFVNVTGDVIEHFLLNCPLLERLVVNGSEAPESIKVVALLPLRLKHLEIICCHNLKVLKYVCQISCHFN
ncbi:hypothetical protein Tsubulata_021078 [Turnera subulata]|uniref:At1g61320/AtMIF1 LRR domain-containing protein n=1 Tax=Turnera subulata TaxID=218843 RepID=A0A9Q0JEB9_9ROSI|nr:hypothetical protein Tsubulata_021078 [Turnera subulata]